MSLLAVPTRRRGCHASTMCRSTACFQALLEAQAATFPVRITAEACPTHAGAMVCGLTAWAHDHNLTGGKLAVFTIDPSRPGADPRD